MHWALSTSALQVANVMANASAKYKVLVTFARALRTQRTVCMAKENKGMMYIKKNRKNRKENSIQI